MASPKIELSLLFDSIQRSISTGLFRLRDEFIRERAAGVPDETIIQRLREQRDRPERFGTINGVKNTVAEEISNSMRGIYNTTQQEWGTATAAAERFPNKAQFQFLQDGKFVLPEEAGYTVTLDDLGRRITNLGEGETDSGRAIARQVRHDNRLRALESEARQAEGDASYVAKQNITQIWTCVFKNTCPDCLRLAGTAKTKLEWQQGGITPGSGQTICGENCQCFLVDVSAIAKRLGVKYDPDRESEIVGDVQSRLSNGFQLQKDRIKAMVEKRGGTPYSESYQNQMLGQLMTDRFWVNQKKTNIYRKATGKVEKSFTENVNVRT